MKVIFNSLGSNYNFSFVKQALCLLCKKNKQAVTNLQKLLNTKYHGSSLLTYKGRDAIELAIKVLSLDKKPVVLTQAFSCFAVEEGIKRAGGTAVYVDIENNRTNLSLATLKQAYLKHPQANFVLVQYSLGLPLDIKKIAQWCKVNNLILIEDVAQGIGGDQIGNYGDAVVFSFGRDKIIDAVSGGAVVFRSLTAKQKKRMKLVSFQMLKSLNANQVIRDMFYPLVTFVGRKTYRHIIGKVVIKLAKVTNFLTSPTLSPTNQPTLLPDVYASLVLISFSSLTRQLELRRKKAKLYHAEFLKWLKMSNNYFGISLLEDKDDLELGSNLKFVVRVKKMTELIKYLTKHQLYLSDRWYRHAVDCGNFSCHSSYQLGTARNAEKLSKEVFNLPTHQDITLDEIKRIVKLIMQR